MTTLNERVAELEASLNEVIVDHGPEIRTAVQALCVAQHWVSIGEPGTAKTMMVSELARRIDLPPGGFFRRQMSAYTQPTRIFGIIDIEAAQRGQNRLITTGMAPEAHLVFFDELFRAGVVLDDILEFLADRLFPNGDDDPRRPLRSAYATSNHIPSGDQHAAWDRFLYRLRSEYVRTREDFGVLMNLPEPDGVEPLLSLADLEAAEAEIHKVNLPDSVLEVMWDLRSDLAAASIVISDRRFRWSKLAIQAEAWMCGADEIEIPHLAPLAHTLWGTDDSYEVVREKVIMLADPIEHQAIQEQRKLDGMWDELQKSLVGLAGRELVGACKEGLRKVLTSKELAKELGQKAEGREPRALTHLLADVEQKGATLVRTMKAPS